MLMIKTSNKNILKIIVLVCVWRGGRGAINFCKNAKIDYALCARANFRTRPALFNMCKSTYKKPLIIKYKTFAF